MITANRPIAKRLSRRAWPEAAGFVLFVGSLIATASSLVVGLILTGTEFGPVWPVLALATLAYMAERQDVRLNDTTWLSVSFLPLVFAAVAFGPLAAITVGVLGLLAEFQAPYLRWAVWSASRALVGGAAGLAAMAGSWVVTDPFPRFLVAASLAAVVDVFVDIVLGGATVRVRRSGSFAAVVRTQAPFSLWALPFYAPVIAVLAYAYYELSAWSVALFLGPAFVAQRFFVLYRQERRAAAELEEANVRLAKANISFATALVATLDARDRYTAGHSAAVAIYARDIAERMLLPEETRELAHLCGLVHDIGKIGLSPSLLEKTGPLTLDERRQMETHSAIGESILARVDDYAEIAEIVRHHHERWDGMGYPDGLAGDEVPLLSRIIAVADAYNAMTSDRPYRDAMPSRVARLRLAQAADSQFDTAVVAAFEALLAGADESYRLGQRDDFRFEVQGDIQDFSAAVG